MYKINIYFFSNLPMIVIGTTSFDTIVESLFEDEYIRLPCFTKVVFI